MATGTKIYVIAALVWELGVALIYGLTIHYNTTAFTNMSAQTFQYPFADDNPTFKYYTANGTQIPFPFMVMILAFALIIVGLALVAGYVERNSTTNMALTLLLFALTIQNFFIFRDFFDRGGVNDPNGIRDYTTRYYEKVNYVNFGNRLPVSFTYTSASLIDAVGATLALYAGFTAVMGRVGLGGIFFLSFFGTFFYELNDTILWRLFIPDNGFASRAFAFGGTLGIVSSLILGQRQHTNKNPNFMSTYTMRAMPLLGIILVWCTFPILVTANTYTRVQGQIVAMIGQVNIWLALAGSVIGTYLASIFLYKRFSVGDVVFAVITGGIAYSSSTDINYNPGAAMTIGTVVGLTCAICQNRIRRFVNKNGVLDSNGVLFNFLIPSFFAAVASAILSGIGTTSNSATLATGGSLSGAESFGPNAGSGRSPTTQGGYQLIGWMISISFGLIAGGIIGLMYKLCDSREGPADFFNDFFLYDSPAVPVAKKNEFKGLEPKGLEGLEIQIHSSNKVVGQGQSSYATAK